MFALSSFFSPVLLSHVIHVLHRRTECDCLTSLSFISLCLSLFFSLILHHPIHVGECSWKSLLICRDFWYDHDYITLPQWRKNICVNSARRAAAYLIISLFSSWFFRHCGQLKSAVFCFMWDCLNLHFGCPAPVLINKIHACFTKTLFSPLMSMTTLVRLPDFDV